MELGIQIEGLEVLDHLTAASDWRSPELRALDEARAMAEAIPALYAHFQPACQPALRHLAERRTRARRP